jgi:predicted enzyme related to lactoylglutathione lyase
MSQVTFAPGTFCWIDLGTTDQNGAKHFYTSLFGWTFEDRPLPQGGVYTMLYTQGIGVGALYESPVAQPSVPPRWLPYISVKEVDAVTSQVPELGGRIFAPPFDVMTVGRMSVLQDPAGALVALWEPRMHQGFGDLRQSKSGAPCWFELVTPDKAKARAFYGALLGWEMKDADFSGNTYTQIINAGRAQGGMTEPHLAPSGKVPPSHWTTYFHTPDCAVSVKKVSELGGSVCIPPTAIPSVGTIATLQDPQGANFSVIQPDPSVSN